MRSLRSGAHLRQPPLVELLTERYRDGVLDQHDIREDVTAAADACRRLPLGAYPGRDVVGMADGIEAVAGRLLGLAVENSDDPDAAAAVPVVRTACVDPLRAIVEGRTHAWGRRLQ